MERDGGKERKEKVMERWIWKVGQGGKDGEVERGKGGRMERRKEWKETR